MTLFTVIVTLALAVPTVRVRKVIYLQPLFYTVIAKVQVDKT